MSAALLTLLVSVVVLMLLRVPIAFSFLLASLTYFLFFTDVTVGTAILQVISGIEGFVLLAVPLFILTGNLMNISGITDRIFDLVQASFGGVRGSMGYANIGTSVVFAGMSGSAVADAAGLGQIEVNAMRKRGYDMPFALGLTAASSAIGPIVPPSIIAVVYGVTAGVSIGALFMAGIVPGLLMALTLAGMVWYLSRKRSYPKLERVSLRTLGMLTIKAIPPMITPVIILGGIGFGVFTPTEAAAAAAVYAIFLGFVYRSLSAQKLYRSFVSSVGTTAAVMLIVGSATLFSWILTREQAPQGAYAAIAELTAGNLIMFLFVTNVLLLLLGMVLEPIPVMLIMVPILIPVVEDFGMNPVHFGIMMLLNLTIGMLTPPVGNVLFAMSSALKVPMATVVKGVLPFLVPLLIALLLVTYVPWISLALPRLMGLIA